MNLQGIIFDLDGTITLTEPYHYRAFAEIFKRYGIEYFFDEHARRFAASGAAVTFGTIFQEHGKNFSQEELVAFKDEKRKLYTKFVQENEIETVPGAREFIKKIHEKGLKKIIATGNSNLDIVRFILNKIGLLEYFPLMISVSEVPRGKPYPDVFLEAAKRIGCAPSECVVLEDSVNGVSAAKAAGIRCIAFSTTSKRADLLEAGAYKVVKNYFEIIDEMTK